MESSSIAHSQQTSSATFHTHEPDKQPEHQALLDLVSEPASHVAVRSGSWFDPNTWANGQVPGDDATVQIPADVTVTYDGISPARLFTLRVDGQLDFATDVDTQIVLDTFVVTPNGTLTIGTADNPVQGDVTTEIIIADNGPIDISWDPSQLSRGLISHGTVEIHGQPKTTHVKVDLDPAAGDSTLILAEVPTHWQVGDQLVLTGTRYLKDQWNGQEMVWQGTQDEEVTITAIDGNRISLDRPLQYDHDAPGTELKASVANYSRNVVIVSENAETLPANQRGHVMFMHSDSVDVRYAEFHELGRTDKSRPLDDFKLQDGKRVLDADGNPIENNPEDITNQRGRYALHFHRTGVDDINGQPARAVGNAVWGSPGWGYVHHDSHVVLEDNAAYDVFGAAFVTETGNEIGAWRNNIAIKSEGMRSISKSAERVGNHDVAHNGTGFWFQGRLVENQGNIAAGQRHAGMTYLLRGADQKDVLTDNLPNPEIARYEDTLSTGKPAIQGFADNEVLTSKMGLEVIKANPRQHHDVRSIIDGFTAWEVRTGTHLEYTSKYTLKDITVLAAESGSYAGIDFGNNAEDMVVNGAYVEGFKTGVKFKKNHTFADLDDWHYVLIDTQLVGNEQDYENLDPTQDKVLTSADLTPGQLGFTPDGSADFVFSPDRSDRKAVLTGTKTDSIGQIDYPSGSDSAVFKLSSLKNRLQQGYFVDAEGTRFFTVEELFADRATGELLKQEYVITLTDDWNSFTLGGTLGEAPLLGTYSGVVQPGPITDSLDAWVEQYLPSSPIEEPVEEEGATDVDTEAETPNPSPTEEAPTASDEEVTETETPMEVEDGSPAGEDSPSSPMEGSTSSPTAEMDDAIGEYGTLDLNHQWQTVSLQDTYENPVVIVSDPTYNGSDPAAIRLRNVSGDSFQLRLQEPTYKDDWHTRESVSYVVVEAGDWTLADGTRLSAGQHSSARLTSAGFDGISLQNFGSTPAVLTQVQSYNGGDWVTTRTQNSSASGFQLAMQEEEARNDAFHVSESIGWLAIEQSIANDGDTLLQGGSTGRSYDDDPGQVSFEAAFDSAPSVIAKLSSFYGPDTANLRLDSITASSFGVRVHEEQSRDYELSHTQESVSFLALEGTAGILSGFAV